MTREEKIEIARSWIVQGCFAHNGLSYRRGINDFSAVKVLEELMTMTISDLAFDFDNFMTTKFGEGGIPAKGFTIGSGRNLYWYITPMPRSGTYRCVREEDGLLCCPRSLEPDQIVTVRY